MGCCAFGVLVVVRKIVFVSERGPIITVAASCAAFSIHKLYSQLKTVTKSSQYSIRAALTDYVRDITLALKTDWFALFTGHIAD